MMVSQDYEVCKYTDCDVSSNTFSKSALEEVAIMLAL